MDYGNDCIPISEWPPPDVYDSDEENIGIENANDLRFSKKRQNSYDERSKKHRKGYSFPTAEKQLAGWFRRNSTRLKESYEFPVNCNPRTVLNIAAESIEGKELLRNALNEIVEDHDDFKEDPDYFYILATYYDKLKDTKLAMEEVSKCLSLLKIDPEILCEPVAKYTSLLNMLNEVEKNVLWLYSKLSAIDSIKTFKKAPTRTKKVAVIDYKDMTQSKFKEHFCNTKTPVVFTNVVSPTKDNWSLEFIQEKAGDCKFEVKTPTAGSTEWAGLETSCHKTISQFLSDRQPGDGQYLFDWSLPLHAPLLDQNFTTPELFQDNYLKKTSTTSLYHNSWPSLFIAQAGTNSGLHVDAFGSHFWMFLISGKKKWTFYSPEDCGALNPTFYDSLDPVFRPTPAQLETVHSYNVELDEGQLLFVPGGSPHRVENMQDTVAVSGNFVNDTNIEEVVKHLKVNALIDPRTEALLAEFHDMKLVE
eukprot:GFUD01016263.1.p1 GENE.GFUD01016263.1~~GFUD01016263.1.p1  ORF type:complete len:476 (+),score=111.48 GFUD01016263.1:65-1492(+)